MNNIRQLSGNELFLLVQQGDEAARGKFYKKYKLVLMLRAYKKLGNFHEAEDIVHDILLYVFENVHRINLIKGIDAYLYGALNNRIAEFIRTKITERKRDKEYIELKTEEVQKEPTLEEKELRDAIYLAIREMSNQSRLAFVRSRVEGMKLSDIAIEMGINVQSVKNHITRATKLLQKRFGKK